LVARTSSTHIKIGSTARSRLTWERSQIFFFCPTAKGLETLLGDELQRLGAADLEIRRAGVAFSGSLELAYRVCLEAHVASRVICWIGEFHAVDADSLYEGVRTVRWRDQILPESTLAVRFSLGAPSETIVHTQFGAQRTKDAICDQLREETGKRPSVDREQPDLLVAVHLDGTCARIGIDLAGAALHRRGWRTGGAPAPLKENLAAALLLLGNWPERARRGEPFFDPMCGSGTIAVEAATMAAGRAPGLLRRHWGFSGWQGHDPALFSKIVEEARSHERDPKLLPPIWASDIDPAAVDLTRRHATCANVGHALRITNCPLTDARPPNGPPGLLITNPPYGERLGDPHTVAAVYEQLGDTLRRHFPGWTALVLSGSAELPRLGLRPVRRHVLFNGGLECRLLELPISAMPPQGSLGPAWRRPAPEVEMFANRVRKNLRHLEKWARREGISCYRVYDADLPEYAVAIDLYERFVQVQEYEAPSSIDPEKAARRLRDLLTVLPEVIGVEPSHVFVKTRRHRSGSQQYDRHDDRQHFFEVREGGHVFLINLTDYVDTGLFLDHRPLRALVGELASGRDVLNLFCYTASASVYAAQNGARSTTSVDLSNTYLDWAARNFARNHISTGPHRLERADCLKWVRQRSRLYGLIVVDPPTFSNSKRMEETFEVQRDHVALLQACARLLTDDGEILFSNHFRRFKLDEAALSGLVIEPLSSKTVPYDFRRNPRIHNSWRLRKQTGMKRMK
jgi:23S rRNA (guanine2445-N2)-methyltransferase / 23S rRNA (guanine2069-N7)-methyltransferase